MAKNTKTIMHAAETVAKESGLRLTDGRRAVLEIIAGADKPLGAYEILEQLKKYIKNPKPPIAYRALEFLQKNGFVHRIESLNAYVACAANHHHTGSQFMICDQCDYVEEVHLCSVPDALKNKSKKAGFKTAYWNVELHGICKKCEG